MISLLSHPRACTGLPPVNHMLLEHKLPQLMQPFHPLGAGIPVHPKKPVQLAPMHTGGYGNGVIVNGISNGYHSNGE